MKFMHIKFISDKKNFVEPTRSNILPWEVCPRTDFLAFFGKMFGTFWKSGRPWQVYQIVAGHTPNSRGINIYIERVSHNNIGRLGVSKNFQKRILLQQDGFFGDFGVPGGCKSILNVKSFHKSHIAELFGPRLFCFSVDQKNQLNDWFGATLKKF